MQARDEPVIALMQARDVLVIAALQEIQSSWSDYLSRKTIDRRYDFVLEELVAFKSPFIQRALAAISKTC